MLRHLPPAQGDNVIIGTAAPDDAAVYRVRPDLVAVQTVDFFTPVVDDPYVFGQIAAANALSDVWAMGAEPAFALNIVGFPVKRLPLDVLVRILRGGADKCAEAGVPILGGHSVDDPEPKYGLVVTGFARPEEIVTKGGARPGDVLVLTKPLGTGVITTALKQDRAPREAVDAAVTVMLALNRPAAAAMRAAGARACTDVTGFGLLGHLHEMLAQSGVAAEVAAAMVPVIPGALDLAAQGIAPGGTRKNLAYVSEAVRWDGRLGEAMRLILCDATTSGGLLIAAPPDRADSLLAALEAAGTPAAAAIGTVVAGPPGQISVSA